MANPYKKEKQGVAPGGAPKPVAKEEPVVEETPVQENPFSVEIDKKPEGKSYGFYLDVEAARKLEKFAKQNRCSKSKALNALLHKLPE
jgi:hypothetical protein